MAAPTLKNMLDNLSQTQQAFLHLIDQADEDRLYQQSAEDEWSAAMALVHIAEARQFFAGEVQKIVTTPNAKVGRTAEDPHRLQTISNHSHDSVQEIRRQLIDSYEHVVKTLQEITDDDLKLKAEHVKFGPQSLANFIQRFLVGHDQAHVQQVQALLKDQA